MPWCPHRRGRSHSAPSRAPTTAALRAHCSSTTSHGQPSLPTPPPRTCPLAPCTLRLAPCALRSTLARMLTRPSFVARAGVRPSTTSPPGLMMRGRQAPASSLTSPPPKALAVACHLRHHRAPTACPRRLQHSNSNMTIMLIGNKSDLEHRRAVQNSRPGGFGQSTLKHAPPAPDPDAGRPPACSPASTSLGQPRPIGSKFWLTGHTGLVLHIGTAAPCLLRRGSSSRRSTAWSSWKHQPRQQPTSRTCATLAPPPRHMQPRCDPFPTRVLSAGLHQHCQKDLREDPTGRLRCVQRVVRHQGRHGCSVA